ncbi:hypothetical protein ACWGIN_16530 [Streptomyces sp. NPDC054861]
MGVAREGFETVEVVRGTALATGDACRPAEGGPASPGALLAVEPAAQPGARLTTSPAARLAVEPAAQPGARLAVGPWVPPAGRLIAPPAAQAVAVWAAEERGTPLTISEHTKTGPRARLRAPRSTGVTV